MISCVQPVSLPWFSSLWLRHLSPSYWSDVRTRALTFPLSRVQQAPMMLSHRQSSVLWPPLCYGKPKKSRNIYEWDLLLAPVSEGTRFEFDNKSMARESSWYPWCTLVWNHWNMKPQEIWCANMCSLFWLSCLIGRHIICHHYWTPGSIARLNPKPTSCNWWAPAPVETRSLLCW